MSSTDRRQVLGHAELSAPAQHFLVDDRLIDRFVAGLGLASGDLVVDVGVGAGALTLPLARAGAEVWAVEIDPAWAARLTATVRREGLGGSVRVIEADLRRLRFPRRPYRVVARPRPAVDTRVLTVTRRAEPVLPAWLTPTFLDVLRPAWSRAGGGPGAGSRSGALARPPVGDRQHPLGDHLGDSGHEPDQSFHDDAP